MVTNSRFARDFEHWAMLKDGVTVYDDGIALERRPAIGDIAFTLDRAEIDDDVIVIAGTTSTTSPTTSSSGTGRGCERGRRDAGDLRLASTRIVELDEDDRVTAFEEEASELRHDPVRDRDLHLPPRAHAARRRFLDERARTSSAASIERLRAREPVYGYWFTGAWLDVGDSEQLLGDARRAQGLLEREQVRARPVANCFESCTPA